jgi:hypothetical protein
VLVLDMIEILPLLGKYKYDTWRIVPVKCHIDNSVRLRSCIRNINRAHKMKLCVSNGVSIYNHVSNHFKVVSGISSVHN